MKNRNHLSKVILLLMMALNFFAAVAQNLPDQYNVVWNSQSKNSGESMPCGGGDIGLNVWVENNELFFYIAKSGTFDENNTLVKPGRIRIKLSPNPFEGKSFRQELILKDGYVNIMASSGNLTTDISIWVDVFHPAIHVTIKGNTPVITEASYESWRYKDRISNGAANNTNSYKWAAPKEGVENYKDEIGFENNGVLFYHRNNPYTVFDFTVHQQGLDSVKEQLFNPLKNLTSGGRMEGSNMKAAGETEGVYLNTDFKGWKLKSTKATRSQDLTIYLHTGQASNLEDWRNQLNTIIQKTNTDKNALRNTRNWWKEFWDRSFVLINTTGSDTSTAWQVGRNYQLFRYMLGCNAFGTYPTKFNGGLFTYDPELVNKDFSFTPDFRNWGGGIHTAQNQRLVYFPMIKDGDFDLLRPQFDFYLRILKNAELRSRVYWNHDGACFTEQMDNYGLPDCAEYGTTRPAGFDKGLEYNAWLEYLWDTVLEFCYMMLEEERYTQKDVSSYIPFIESCLRFFDEHYQYLAKQRGIKALDDNGHLVLYPGSGAETYKMAYNSTSTIAALQTVTNRLLQLPSKYLGTEDRKYFEGFLNRIPPMSFAQFGGHTTIAPAQSWERINNIESTQLYPVFPWGIYGVGKPGLDIALNTWRYDTNAIKFRSYVGWKQDNIFAARLGLRDEAANLTGLKLKNSGRRFPAFWGPGFDWTPDHNWGGSGMIGLQEMLMQVDDKKIYLLPAWPKDWDVHFKLHAPYQTTVEAVVKNGKIESLTVVPEARKADVVNVFDNH
ncbi:MAG: DUF5703 domain-containing protein [Flavisolibacter sp.]